MPRPPSAASILRNLKKDKRKFEPKTPITTDMFIPNHSGVKNHKEIKNNFVPYIGANANVILGTYNLTTTGKIGFSPTEYISSDNANEMSFHTSINNVGHKFYIGVNEILNIKGYPGFAHLGLIDFAGQMNIRVDNVEYLRGVAGHLLPKVNTWIDAHNKYILWGTAASSGLILHNSANLIINPDHTGTGKVLIGLTGDDDIVFTNGEVKGDLIPTGEGSGLLFGEIYGADTATVISISGTGIANKVQITAFAVDGESNGMTPDHTNDHITVLTAGKYLCNVSMHINSISGGTAEVYGYSVFKNGGTGEFVNLHGQRNMAGSGGDEGSVSLSGIIDLAVDDTVEVWIWNNTNTDNVEVDDINLSLVQIGGT